jgi:hypothetical protein
MNPKFDVIVAILVTLSLLAIPVALAVADTASVSVTVAQAAAIDVNPASFSWSVTGAGVTNATSPNFAVENIGSQNIDVTASVTNSNSNPYGTGVAGNYNAGDFVLLDNTTSGTFYYVENVNWNESKPTYVTSPTGWYEGNQSGLQAIWGYFIRIRSVGLDETGDEGEEYFAFTKNGTATSCSSGASVVVSQVPHNSTQTGTIDFTGSGSETVNDAASSTGVNTVFDAHILDITNNCQAVNMTYWISRQLRAALSPGEERTMRIEVKVPLGVVGGGTPISGTLTITGT